MNENKSNSRETNPRKHANYLSIITFFYNYKLLKKGQKKNLEQSDIYNVLPKFKAETLGDKLENQWNRSRKSRTQLWKLLIKSFGLTYLFYTIIQLFFGTIIIMYQPKVFSIFISTFNQTTDSTIQVLLWALCIGGLLLLNTLYTQNMDQLIAEYSLQIRTAVSSLIFRKALKLRPLPISDISIGKITTLVTKDVFTIDDALTFIKDMICGLLHLIVATYVLYKQVGNAAFSPIVVIFSIIPIQVFCGKRVIQVRLDAAKKTEKRFHLTQEVLNSMKFIKMSMWQKYFETAIGQVRLTEIQKITIMYYLQALIGWLGAFTTNIAFYVLLVTCIIQGSVLTAETVYFIQQCLFTLKFAITVSIPMSICNSADLLASFKRIQDFLDVDEMPSNVISNSSQPHIHLDKVKVVLNDNEILKSVSLHLNEGLLIITGNSGAGKSVVLKTILGEYPIVSGHLEVNGSLSYAPEKPWLFPGSIKDNILFGELFDHDRYHKVLKVCALVYDINSFMDLDNTVVGDQGMNLSKGQQARIALARTVYRNSDIYMFDDCFSCLDSDVSDHIFQQCIRDFLRNKICILVTNKTHLVTPKNNVLFLEDGCTLTLDEQKGGLDKRITYFIDEEVNFLKYHKEPFSKFNEKLEVIVDEDDQENTEENEAASFIKDNSDKDVKENLYREDNAEGRVHRHIYKTYYELMGGFAVYLYLFIAFFAAQSALTYCEKLISIWVNVEEEIAIYQNQTNSSQYTNAISNRWSYLKLYSILVITGMLLSIIKSCSTFYSCLNAARYLHDRLIRSILYASMTFFDKHYIGNIINRLSKDLYVIDEYLPFLVFDIFRLIFSFISVIILVASVKWILLIPAILLIIKLYFIQRLYLPSGRSLKRLEASCRSPVIGILHSSLEGLSIIKASKQEIRIQKEFDQHQDLYTSAFYMNQTAKRFFILILEVCGSMFVIGILLKFIFLFGGESAGEVGLALSQAMILTGILQYAIRQTGELETVMTSVERILEYSKAQMEPLFLEFPEKQVLNGNIQFEKVFMTYSNGTKALNNICLNIASDEKIGVVGRTGAGKSSLVSALLRLYQFDGKITIDGIDIKQLSLKYLRSIITVIPQDPVLFSGSIRSNLDPFDLYDDEKIWHVLDQVNMKLFVTDLEMDASKYTLSFGTIQLLFLARALLQKQKIIILDEVTASLDHHSNRLFQNIVRNYFKTCTVIIIAHKLSSVKWCDKVLTMKDGAIVEFDTPEILMENKQSLFCKMVREENFETFVTLTHF
ncbi:hypothetical protein ABEB36_002720 [Hypothenemus hampei]|uniref:Uncharacterized protein n=1 Tax=Hypothenemus hampei TaxID=57062 RepID=A0ABD1F6S4_HYPHA